MKWTTYVDRNGNADWQIKVRTTGQEGLATREEADLLQADLEDFFRNRDAMRRTMRSINK